MKRLFDIATSLSVLFLLLPLFILISVWIKLDSTGPVFFRQVRVGRLEKRFRIVKFRTMQVGAESAGPQITIGADPRITRCGAVLRRFKLDELPQFFNVLVGQMSVVGPRPEVPKYVDIYSEEMRCKILSVKPGITDPASIQYRGESELLEHSADPGRTYIEEIIPAKLRLGADYIERRTFCRDMAIIVKTLVIIFSRRY